MNVAVKAADKPKVEHKTPQAIKKVGVIGAGQMGTGIAHVIALGGYTVALNDLKKETVERIGAHHREVPEAAGREGHHHGSRREAGAETHQLRAELRGVLRLRLDHRGRDRGRGHEAQDLRRALPEAEADRAMLATNTSSISITRLASTTDRPEHFIGMHFMNPVPLMELVELIRGIATDDDMFALARTFVESLGKKVAVSEDFPAFIVNRILLPMINEAVYTLYEGVGTVEAIDKAMKLGAHHPMGPLELADFIGLDTCLSVMQVLYEGLSDSKYRPCPLLVKYVEAGWLGRKTHRGFYDYRGEKPVPTR